MRYANDSNTMQVTKSLAMTMEKDGAMICINGVNIGQMVPLEGEKKVYVGRSPAHCSYIIDQIQVSRIHMEITYIPALDAYKIVDYSSNGTYVKRGNNNSFVRIEKNTDYYLKSMDEIRLGMSNEIYKLR